MTSPSWENRRLGRERMPLVEMRVRTKIPKTELDKKLGKVVTDTDFNVLLTGPTKVTSPSGEPLFIYLPKAIPQEILDEHYDTLHEISLDSRNSTDNRGMASGSQYIKINKVKKANKVKSTVVGYLDGSKKTHRFPYCRTTAWTGRSTDEFKSLYPMFQAVGKLFETYEPKRYAVQKKRADASDPSWVVPNTPYTTFTVNNTYPTGVHVDKGDLDKGFSCLAVWRRGKYAGGYLTLPEWRIAVDMKEGDLVLMDAHQWHGNTSMELLSPDAERISVVLYYRTEVLNCGSWDEEYAKMLDSKKGKIKVADK